MKTLIGGQEISLDEREVTIAKRAVNKLLYSMKKTGMRSGRPTLWLTAAMVMYVKALDVIEGVEPENIKKFVELLKARENVAGGRGEEKEERA
jgi:hypothetical protein